MPRHLHKVGSAQYQGRAADACHDEPACNAAYPVFVRAVGFKHVVETSEHAMQVRVLVSAADAGKTWDLRCRVREKLIDFIQREYPHCLPHLRTDIRNERASDGPGQFTSIASAKQGA